MWFGTKGGRLTSHPSTWSTALGFFFTLFPPLVVVVVMARGHCDLHGVYISSHLGWF